MGKDKDIDKKIAKTANHYSLEHNVHNLIYSCANLTAVLASLPEIVSMGNLELYDQTVDTISALIATTEVGIKYIEKSLLIEDEVEKNIDTAVEVGFNAINEKE